MLVFLVGLPASRLPVPGLGDLWLDPGLVIVSGVALQGPSEHTSWPMTVPNDAALVLVAFAQQVLSGKLYGVFKLSNPVVYCHD